MKIGDYVRVKDYQDIQHIIKIEKILDNYTIFSKNGYWSTENIIKSSPNIIDLIEVGDYVNGLRVNEKAPEDKRKKQQICVDAPYMEYGEDWLKNNDIESIVTKEQFESMEYKI